MKNSFIYKKINKVLVLIIMYLVLVPNICAASNPYPQYQNSPFGGQVISCTWYAWQQAHDRMGVDLPFWTNVETWYSKASEAGYSVGREPKVNSIMIWDYGEGFGGHAAYVTGVNGDTVVFDEGGSPMTSDGINTNEEYPLTVINEFLVGFIYLDVPRKVETTPIIDNSSSNNNQEVKPVEETKPVEVIKPVIKSSDNKLSNLFIEGVELEFNEDKLDYKIEVENSLQKINIAATANDSKATVSGDGDYNLNVGENVFVVKVTAEDESIREYNIIIIRKDKEKIIDKENSKLNNIEKNNQKTNKIQKNNFITIIVIDISLILIFIVCLIIYKVKKHKK